MPIRLPWRKEKDFPTLLHVTHIKAGSTWVHGLMKNLFGKSVMPRFGSEIFSKDQKKDDKSDGSQQPAYLKMFQAMDYRPGWAYPAMFITKSEFDSRPEFVQAKRFVMIRDLRDTLTSHYFSLKNTHALDKHGRVQVAREYLRDASKDDGFLFLFNRDLERLLEIQRSWLEAGEIVIRYEDIIAADIAGFTDLFINRLQLPVTAKQVAEAVEASRFEKVFQRKLGELDESSHGRQGLPGDWKNHFSARLRREFQSRAGELLILAGYEKDDSWVE